MTDNEYRREKSGMRGMERCKTLNKCIILTNFAFVLRQDLCHPNRSAVAGSRLTAASTSQAQVILLPQPPK